MKITYTDKEYLDINSDVPDKNKVTDDDLNEIKNVVNTNYDEAGNISNLDTTDKTSLVNAINEIVPDITASANAGHISIGKVGIEWGTVSVTPSSGYGAQKIEFVNTYQYAPVAIACAGVGLSTITNVGTFSVTTTGCNIFLVASGTTARLCRYLVVGVLA